MKFVDDDDDDEVSLLARSMLNRADFRKDKVKVLLICRNGELHHWANDTWSATE